MVSSVSILIPTHNRANLLEQTLDSIITLRVPPTIGVDLIVVANACSDSTVAVCEKLFPSLPVRARCLQEPRTGLSIARNTAMWESSGEICAFLDDDVRVSHAWLEAMIDVCRTFPADIVGGKVELWWEAVERPFWFAPELDSYLSKLDHGDEVIELFPPNSIVGANFSFKRAIFRPTGPFRADLGRIGGDLLSTEDTEFCQRAMKQGARMFYAPQMKIKHWVAPQRVSVEYLVGVSRGFTKGRILAKRPFGPRLFLRSFLGNSYRVARYELARQVAKFRGDRAREVAARVNRAGAQAGVSTSLIRVLAAWK